MAQRNNEENTMDKAKKTVERVTDINLDDATDRIQSGIREVSRQVKSGLRGARVNQNTIPNAFRRVPKFISPRVHAWLDVAVTGYFFVLGTVCAFRGRGGAATSAFINAGMVAGVSLFTDYEGTGEKPINFKMHGTLDAIQATTAALGPVLHGFAGEAEAAFFYGQAANEVAVIAGTDWDAGLPARRRRRAA